MPIYGNKNRNLLQELPGQSQSLVGIMRLIAPGLPPKLPHGNLLTHLHYGKVGQDLKLLVRRRSPVGEARAHGKALLENGSEVGREGEPKRGFDGGEFRVRETLLDGNVASGKMLDHVLGIGGDGEANSHGLGPAGTERFRIHRCL